jgi:hypothetical protein
MNYKQISERIAGIINKPFNHELKERIKDSFKSILATRVRQSFAKNGIDDSMLLSYNLELEPINEIENIIKDITKKPVILNDIKYKLRTKDKVLGSIRFANDAPFTKVCTLSNIIIPYKKITEIKYDSLRFSSELSYFMNNGYIIIIGKSILPKIKYITIESVFEDMDMVLGYYNDVVNEEDIEIPIPRDMVESIIQEMLKTEFGILPVEEKTIELDK